MNRQTRIIVFLILAFETGQAAAKHRMWSPWWIAGTLVASISMIVFFRAIMKKEKS